MPLSPQDLELRLRQALAPSALHVSDESAAHAGHSGVNAEGYGSHFRVRIASTRFAGLSRVAQHRLVYDALDDCHALGLHALAIETQPSA